MIIQIFYFGQLSLRPKHFFINKITQLAQLYFSLQQVQMESRVGLIKFKRNQIGTGVLIGPRLVLTAPYNICSQKNQTKHQENIQFVLGKSAQSQLQIYTVVDFRVHKQYGKDKQKDRLKCWYALLKLDRCVKFISFPILQANFQFDQGVIMSLFGYPAYQQKYLTSNTRNYELQQTQYILSSILDIRQGLIWYNLQTQSGEGGGPIVVKRSSEYFIVGIHLVKQKKEKIGLVISQEIQNNIVVWAKQMDCQYSKKPIQKWQNQSVQQQKRQIQRQDFVKYKELERNIQILREQNSQLQKYKSKYQSALKILRQLEDIKRLTIDNLAKKINVVHEMILKHKLESPENYAPISSNKLKVQQLNKSELQNSLDSFENQSNK